MDARDATAFAHVLWTKVEELRGASSAKDRYDVGYVDGFEDAALMVDRWAVDLANPDVGEVS